MARVLPGAEAPLLISSAGRACPLRPSARLAKAALELPDGHKGLPPQPGLFLLVIMCGQKRRVRSVRPGPRH